MFALRPWRRVLAPLPPPERPLAWLPEEWVKLFSMPLLEARERLFRYPLTMEEKEKEVIVRTELPGFTSEEVKVEVRGEALTIEAEHKEPAEKPEAERERLYRHVERAVTLPPTVEMEKAEATYRNGVLEVHLPRKPEAVGRRLEVKV